MLGVISTKKYKFEFIIYRVKCYLNKEQPVKTVNVVFKESTIGFLFCLIGPHGNAVIILYRMASVQN